MTDCIPLYVQVRTRRRELDIKQTDLARRSGVDQAVLSRFENGKMCNIGVMKLESIFKALGYEEYKINMPKL